MKRILWIALIQIALMLAFVADVNARELHDFYNGVRCLGMGGACAAVVNDETALLVNPAALGKLRDFYGTIIDPEVEANTNLPGMYSDSSFSNPFSLDDVKGALDKNRGSYYHAKAQVFPSFVGRNFGIGLYGNSMLDAQMAEDGTTIDTFYRSDLALVLGFNFRFFDGRLKIGANTKLVDRQEVNDDKVSTASSTSYSDIAKSGLGLSTDVGVILSAPWVLLPTVSAVLHDVGTTSYNLGSGLRMSTANHPDTVDQSLDVAVAIFPIHTNYVRSSWTIEYRDLLSTEDDKMKLLHAGMEFNFGDVFFMRAGYNQRYWTAGLELASEHFQYQLASYGEEVGTKDATKEDRRYVFKFAFRF
ncbi:hypothetical protein [Bdellovibrio sp. NC01]|uniref:hypothetical protein n=1 Tax=Bdellovibrio sp. NC01 TaxID=2220073 RepID=UPI001FED6819|nr:hypothetical protein [Bdellovibrio sp. NC01]